MTTATTRRLPDAPASTSAGAAMASSPAPLPAAIAAAWYDPDGAAWEADLTPRAESADSIPPRLAMRLDLDDLDFGN